ncbi:MAG: exodeoxyribonuclease V subunit gamma [Desulfobulbaceae bacterium]|jgi:exodeoxyribonuclease V gamma subunit|nr:exodeoxyribonuclease V subunit gamma [Desulfobulbaceae bacterium]
MFFLHVSNRSENLLTHLAAVFQADERPDPLSPELFVVQSQGCELMIRQFLADKFISWANYRFLYPMAFIAQLAKLLAVPADAAAFERGRLVWRLEALLRSEQAPVVSAYLAQEPVALKRYQLARQLAGLFDQYQLMRPEMLAAWQKGRTVTQNAHEIWQADLWRRLRAQTPDAPHRGEILARLIDCLAENKIKSSLASPVPRRLSIFGLHSMPPPLLHCFNALSRLVDIHLYLLSPCRNYWLDARRFSRDDDGMAEAYHPLLVSLGQEGREFQAMLEETVHPDLRPTSYHFPLDDGKPTALRQLQADILDGFKPAAGQVLPADDSLRLAVCFSRRREVEVLKDHILDFLEKNTDLDLRDLLVMAPDIGHYAPFIPAIFRDIPHSIADRALSRENRVLAILLDFLRLLRGRCGWATILDALGREPLATAWGLTQPDLETLRHWTPASGIRWGLDGDHANSFAAPVSGGCSFGLTNTWQAGLARMTLGFALGDGPPFHGIAPWAGVEGGDARLLGRLHRFIDLTRKTLNEFVVDCPLSLWSHRCLRLLTDLFPNFDDQDDGQELAACRQIIASLTTVQPNEHNEPINLAVLIHWLRQQAETPMAGGFLRGRLTFCSMLPMRSIPGAGIFLLGLNDGEFPRRDAMASFDLLREGGRLGDRSVRADDRYQFLEAILAARRTLYLSYVGKSAKKGEDLPPSVVVSEFLETLGRDYGLRDLPVQQPLHPFDRRYFSGENEKLFTYAEEFAAKRQTPARKRDAPWWRGEIAWDEPDTPFAAWLEFVAHPQRYFFRRRLGLNLRQAAAPIAESEIFTANALELWQAKGEMLAAIGRGESAATTMMKLTASGLWPIGGPGQALFQAQWREMTAFAANIAQLDLGEPLPPRFFALEVAHRPCHGMLGGGYERGFLLANHRAMKGKDLLQGWLVAQLLRRLDDAPPQVFLAFDDGVFFLQPTAAAAPSLEDLAELFIQGNRAPSPLLVEPALAWARQEYSTSNRQSLSPGDKAEKALQEQLKAGREPEWAKLFAHETPPLWKAEREAAARAFMLPIVACLVPT